MNIFEKALRSKTVWTILVLFIISGVEGIRQFIPLEFLPYVQSLLGLLSVWWKLNPSQDY